VVWEVMNSAIVPRYWLPIGKGRSETREFLEASTRKVPPSRYARSAVWRDEKFAHCAAICRNKPLTLPSFPGARFEAIVHAIMLLPAQAIKFNHKGRPVTVVSSEPLDRTLLPLDAWDTVPSIPKVRVTMCDQRFTGNDSYRPPLWLNLIALRRYRA